MSNKQNSIRTVEIQSMDSKGRGVGITETGGSLRVPYTIPGEEVKAEKRRKDGALLEVITPSVHRVDPRCSHFKTCGGCTWQHIEYDHQLWLKQQKIRNLFQRYQIDVTAFTIPIEPSIPYAYRNRMDFVWWYDGRFGLRERGKWHSVVDLQECHLVPDYLMNAALEVNRRVHDAHLVFHDQKKEIPGLRYLVVRCGVFTGEVMLSFVSDSMDIPSSVWEGIPQLASVYQLVNNNPKSDLSDGEPFHLWGAEYIHDRIGRHDFYYHCRSFFQPNPVMAEKMVETVRGYLKQEQRVLRKLVDLYCGVGLFSIMLSDLFDEVTGIEVSDESIRIAKQNSLGLNVTFVADDAINISPELINNTDVLLVDPPREGLHPKVLKRILEAEPGVLVYVSCNPARGVEDISKMLDKYELKDVRLFDQFPQTPHVEMISMLSKKKEGYSTS